MSEPNAFEPAWDVEFPEPPFMSRAMPRAMRLGAYAGAREVGATLYEIDPGGANAPYHAHHGPTLAVLGPRDGRMFPAGSDIPFVEAVVRAIRAAPAPPERDA